MTLLQAGSQMEILNHLFKYFGINTPPQRETICSLRVMQINAPKHPNCLMNLFFKQQNRILSHRTPEDTPKVKFREVMCL